MTNSSPLGGGCDVGATGVVGATGSHGGTSGISISDLMTQIPKIAVLGPDDKLLIHLKPGMTNDDLQELCQSLITVGLENQAVIFSEDKIETLVVVNAPVNTQGIVEGSREILEEMAELNPPSRCNCGKGFCCPVHGTHSDPHKKCILR